MATALEHIRDIINENTRVAGLKSGSADSDAPSTPNAVDIAATRLDYQLALLYSQRSTQAVSMVVDGFNSLTGQRDTANPTIANFYDVYGATYPSVVASSQIHYGTPIGVTIEDQPRTRGSIVLDAVKASLDAWGIKCLVPDYFYNDFGDTHSLVLMVDSLNVQNTLATLDPLVAQSTLSLVLQGASNAKMQTGGGSNNQGKAEGDTLEKTLDALRKIVQGPSITKTPANMEGGTWADISARNVFDNNLKALTDSPAFKNIVGKVTVTSIAGDSSLPAKARTDFSALLTLITLSPLAVTAAAGYASVVESALATGWSTVHMDWLADKAAAASGGVVGNYTDTYLNDRQALLQWAAVENINNIQAAPDGYIPLVGKGVASHDTRFIDLTSGNLRQVYAYLSPTNAPNVYVIFGDEKDNTANGAAEDDRLYGGAGNDIINGLGGYDYLEGNTGADSLDGGDDADTLLGGAGDDSLQGGTGNDQLSGGTGADRYVVGRGEGVDHVLSSEAADSLSLAGRVLTGQGRLLGSLRGSQWPLAHNALETR